MSIYTRLVVTDSLRGFFLSALVPITEVVLMLIFIHTLAASTWEKTFLGVLLKSSFVLSLPLSIWIFRKKISLPHILVFINVIGALALLATIFIKSTFLFLGVVCIIAFPHDGIHPLMAEFYSRYPRVSRGRRFAISGVLMTIGSIFFAYIFQSIIGGGSWLGGNLVGYDGVVIMGAGALLVSTLFAYRLPRLKTKSEPAQLRLSGVLKILKTDKLFLTILISWMFLGISNLWVLAYRTNYLSESGFGFNYTEERVIFLLVGLPLMVQLLLMFPMSYIFDKLNFLYLRMMVNFVLCLYVIFFFFSKSYEGIVLGMVMFGIGRAGGSICWKLWVNQMVPPSKVGMYMAIHTGFTGFRMLFAPFFGLWGLYVLGGVVCGLISLALLLVSIVLLVPVLGKGKTRLKY